MYKDWYIEDYVFEERKVDKKWLDLGDKVLKQHKLIEKSPYGKRISGVLYTLTGASVLLFDGEMVSGNLNTETGKSDFKVEPLDFSVSFCPRARAGEENNDG